MTKRTSSTIFRRIAKAISKIWGKRSGCNKEVCKVVTDKKEIEGLPATALALTAHTAVSKGIDGFRVEKVLETVHIAANKNTVPGMCLLWFLVALGWELWP